MSDNLHHNAGAQNRASKSPVRFSLILPCYNEIEHIERSLEKIESYLSFLYAPGSYEIILIDDGSRDGTRELIRQYASREPFQVRWNEKNLGRGGTVKRGMQLARGEICGFIDIDCEVSEAYIPKFVHAVSVGHDMVSGDREYALSWTPMVLFRHFLSAAYRRFTKVMLDNPVRDSESGYKFFSARARAEILSLSQFDDWFWDTETGLICAMQGLKILELPVLFIRNQAKTSTVRIVHDTLAYLKSVLRFRELASQGKYTKVASSEDGLSKASGM